jgi:hypothetical protein
VFLIGWFGGNEASRQVGNPMRQVGNPMCKLVIVEQYYHQE